MLSKQELVNLIASATSNEDDSYKSMQELVYIIAQCVDVDEDGNT